jgi:filamentous hemagglutinin family protein
MKHVWLLSGAIAPLLLFLGESPGFGQIIPDDSLGNERSRLTPDASIGIGFTADRIDGGARRGANLFHSFSEFNVRLGQQVYFANPTGVENILSRVTGSSRSEILGTLGVNGSANLFLLNPNGILFGANAALDVRGSFVASTANRIVFAGDEFSALNPQIPALLTVNVPIGLQYGQAPGRIVNQSGFTLSGLTTNDLVIGGLRVRSGHTLALLGGDVLFRDGHAIAPEGRIELGSVRNGTISLTPDATQGFVMSYPDGTFQEIRFSEESTVTTTGEGGESGSGNLHIQAGRLRVVERSQLSTTTVGSGDGGLLSITATDSIDLIGNLSRRINEITGLVADSQSPRPEGGDAGNIRIHTRRLTLEDGAQITTFTSGGGNSGNIAVVAAESISMRLTFSSSINSINSGTQEGSTGNAGSIRISTGRLSLGEGSQILSSTFSSGQSGQVIVNASESIQLSGTGIVFPPTPLPIPADPTPAPMPAPIPLPREERVRPRIIPSLISTQTQGSGQGGRLVVNTQQLTLLDSGQISATAFSSGNAGDVDINATESIFLGGERSPDRRLSSSISAQVDVGASGNGGNLTINTPRLTMRNGTRISTGTIETSVGNAGNLTIHASAIDLQGSNFFRIPSVTALEERASGISSASRGSGNAGTVRIHTESLQLDDRAEVAVSTEGEDAIAGNLRIRADTMQLSDRSTLTAETRSGDGGNLVLQAQDRLTLRNTSRISTTAGLAGVRGDGGDIDLKADFVVAFPMENSDITANAFEGNGGNITITTQGIFGLEFRDRLTDQSDITASSEFGVAGEVTLNTPEVDPSQGLVELPNNLTDPSRLIAQACPTGISDKPLSEFVVTGRGGIPPHPTQLLNSETGLVEWVNLPEANAAMLEPQNRLVDSTYPLEAQGWMVDETGQIVLVASNNNPVAGTIATCPQI